MDVSVQTDDSHLSALTAADDSQLISRCEELGLGRGINASDPQMWKNKSSFVVRKICPRLSNVIWTEESGSKEEYTKEVSTVATQQLKIRFSLEDPTSKVQIGMDALRSQSTSSREIISGTRINTRNISFRIDFNDLPAHSLQDLLPPHSHRGLCEFEGYHANHFEEDLYTWILRQLPISTPTQESEATPTLDSKESQASSKDQRGVRDSPALELQRYLDSLEKQSPQLKAINEYCKKFVADFGITHYISAIELGALKYKSMAIKDQHTKLGAGAELGVASSAEGRLKATITKKLAESSRLEQEIGRINEKGEVDRDTPGEAVIGFQIQPIHKLVKIWPIQVAVQHAIKLYIKTKADKSEGPFLISCQMNDKPVYWTVNEKDGYQIVGTESLKDADLFYFIPTEDTFHPSDFFIAYWGKKKTDRNRLMNVTEPVVEKESKQLLLPHYLSTESNVFGYCSGPLTLKTTVEMKQARFCLHSRVQHSFAFMMCQSTPVSLSDWIEGEKFYINCSHHSLKVDGYIAMEKEKDKRIQQNEQSEKLLRTEEQGDQAEVTEGPKEHQENASYKTITVPSVKDPGKNQDIGMMFRLLPPAYRDKSRQPVAPDQDTTQRPVPPAQDSSQGEVPQIDHVHEKSTKGLSAIQQSDYDAQSVMRYKWQYADLFGSTHTQTQTD